VLVKASSVVRPAAVGGIAGFMLLTMSSNVFGASVAQQGSRAATATPSPCAKRPQAAVLAAAVGPSASATPPSGHAAPHATPTISESTVPSQPTSAGPIASPTAPVTGTEAPPPTTTSDPPSSPAPTKTPTPTPSGSSPSPSPSPTKSSPSPSPSPSEPQLCVQVQSLSGSATVQAGHKASFVVWVWSSRGASNSVTVTAKVATAKNIGAPKFTVCPRASGASCTLGTLPANQSDELQVVAAVEPAATSSEHVKLTATATGKSVLSGSATGSLAVTAKSPTGTAGSPGSGGQGVGAPPESFPPLGPIPAPPGVGNPAGLFPTVAPIPGGSSPTIGFPPARKQAGRTSRAETASSIVPLDPRLIGGQLAGLAVLAGAIAIAIARLSLRRPRSQDGSQDKRDGD
jgi:hypothetical protein